MPTTQMKTRENPIDDMWRAIFSPRHEPVREFKKRARHATIIVNHPTKKAPRGQMIRARLPLMADGLSHLDVTAEVIRVSEYPLVVNYTMIRGDGKPTNRTHHPDLAVLISDGRVLVIDYVPLNIQDRRPRNYREAKRRGIAEALAELGATYVIQDEACIHLQPRWHNVCEMWKHMHENGQHPGISEIRRQVLEGPLPATIGQLMRRVTPNTLTSRSPDEPPEAAKILTEFNPTYTAVLQLAAAGRVRLDHSKALSINSIVSRKA